jgi:hypothetical protein
MSAFRVVAFFEGAELDMNLVSWPDRHSIIEGCNALWKHAETPDVKYRTLPNDDGELYVFPGVFDECRCSDSEVTLGDKLGVFDYDDHHFRQTVLPEDVHEQHMLFMEEDGTLRERYLTKSTFPLLEPTGMSVRFEYVDWDSTREDKILAWLKETDKNCYSYNKYIWFFKTKHSNVPDDIWEFFDFKEKLLDLWKKKEIAIIYDDEEGEFLRLEDVGERYPLWKGKETDWFYDHPCKDLFYIVY